MAKDKGSDAKAKAAKAKDKFAAARAKRPRVTVPVKDPARYSQEQEAKRYTW